MTVVTSDIPQLLTSGLKTIFFDTYGLTPAEWQNIATMVTSSKDTEDYAWLGSLPGVQQFLDERQIGEFSEYEYAIKNKTWESTIGIDRAALEDDQYGQIVTRTKQMAMSAKQHLDILVFGLLAAGFASVCYDGLSFFNSAHPSGKRAGAGTQSNTGTGALSAGSLQSAITTMMRFQDDQGRPMGVMPDLLVVPPEQYWEASTLLNSTFFPDPNTTANSNMGNNPLKGMLRLHTSPYLSSTASWFVLDTKRAVRAIVLQMRKDFEFEALEGTSETGFLRDRYLYGVRARYNVGYGDWRAAYGSTGAD